MKYTTNLKLKKPDLTDVVNIEDLNGNADAIDTSLAEMVKKSDLVFSTSGYQKLPNGLIIQWLYKGSGGTGPVGVNFPIAFPNNILAVTALANMNGGVSIGYMDPIKTGVNLYLSQSAGAFVIALGY